MIPMLFPCKKCHAVGVMFWPGVFHCHYCGDWFNWFNSKDKEEVKMCCKDMENLKAELSDKEKEISMVRSANRAQTELTQNWYAKYQAVSEERDFLKLEREKMQSMRFTSVQYKAMEEELESVKEGYRKVAKLADHYKRKYEDEKRKHPFGCKEGDRVSHASYGTGTVFGRRHQRNGLWYIGVDWDNGTCNFAQENLLK